MRRSLYQPTVRQQYSPALNMTTFSVDVPDALIQKPKDQLRYLAEALHHLTLATLRDQLEDGKAKLLFLLSARFVAATLHVTVLGRPGNRGKHPYRAKRRIVSKTRPVDCVEGKEGGADG